MGVIDITARLQQNKEQAEREKMQTWFFQMFGDQDPEVLKEIRKAILDKDLEAYRKVTEPIIMRKTLKEFNRKERG